MKPTRLTRTHKSSQNHFPDGSFTCILNRSVRSRLWIRRSGNDRRTNAQAGDSYILLYTNDN
ncbi:hypothetical protein AG1IA_04368 [Rhizoctonia solani AG-1 IA]|uniref:Uncharacterized protein n=1 Tax=Thanatephorus cucumeris (strain AG1-IA) TaxID=983506 RepID=L8WXP8_THACA|nr:hypothetical protein AG1IA_04368 [Rhizoctonia solani AG-1 IA]